MTWRWRICSSLLWLSAAAMAAEVSVTGSVRLADSKSGQDRSGVVLWLEPLNGAAAPAPAATTARMEQKNKRFSPSVLAIPVGTAVEFPNLDPIFHNAFSSFAGQIFDLGLYAPGSSRTVTFTRPGVVRVFCNIHPTMSAVIVVLRHPWFAVSNRAGAFAISNVPSGEYELHVFHERATEATLKALVRKVTVGSEGLALPVVSISETGYVVTPHKNKYGQEYPPAHDDHTGYAGHPK